MQDEEALESELLVVGSQRGDVRAFALLVDRWHGRLLATARRLTRDEHAALDAVQEAWMTVVKGLPKLEDPGAFPAWAFRIVRNKCADWQRKSRRHRDLEQQAEPEAESRSGSAQSLALAEALATLPEQQRAAVVLYYYEGFTVAEVAQIESVPPGTVKSRLYQARESLRRFLKEG